MCSPHCAHPVQFPCTLQSCLVLDQIAQVSDSSVLAMHVILQKCILHKHKCMLLALVMLLWTGTSFIPYSTQKSQFWPVHGGDTTWMQCCIRCNVDTLTWHRYAHCTHWHGLDTWRTARQTVLHSSILILLQHKQHCVYHLYHNINSTVCIMHYNINSTVCIMNYNINSTVYITA